MFSRSFISFLIFILFATTCLSQGRTDLPPNPEAGKCYAKCMVEDRIVDNIKHEEVTYSIYTGTDPLIKTDEIVVTIQPKRMKVVENKDGTKHGQITQKAISRKIIIPKKLKKVPTKDISRETLKIYTGEIYFDEGGLSKWTEVLCKNQITPDLIRRLSIALINQNYAVEQTETFDLPLMNALKEYQKENRFPVGSLNPETLKNLGLHF